LSIAEDFLLIATDSDTGRPMIGATQSAPALGGAFLFDLVGAGRLALEGRGRSARVAVADHTPVDVPIVEQAFARVRNKGRLTPSKCVSMMGKQAKGLVYESLVADGTLRRRPAKALGLFPLNRYDVVDTTRRDDLRTRIRASLVHDQPADAETRPLIGLLSAAGMTKIVVDRPDRRMAKARAKVLSEGDWISEGVRAAIRSAQVAMS
jgi:hypothetical protein